MPEQLKEMRKQEHKKQRELKALSKA